MPTGSYQSGSSKRLFINYPFKKGMAFQNLISGEFSCKTLINYDYSNAGDYVYPRPAFVNALLHNGNNTITLPESTVVMTTNAGPKFLVSVQEYVDETVFANDEINVSSEPITGVYGLHIHRILNDVTGFETSRGAKRVFLDYVWDGDTIDVKDTVDGPTYRVRLLGVDTPEEGYPYHGEAKDFLEDYLAGKTIYLVFEPASEISKTIDGNTRYYAYVFAGNYLVNYLILRQGYGYLAYISDSYIFYDELREAYYAAVADEWRLHGTETDYVALIGLEYESTASIANHSGYSLIADTIPTNELYFKKDVYEITDIDTNFYDTQGFIAAELLPTDLFTPNATTKIQMEYNWYTKNEHGHTVQYLEFPHANHTWRNAMSFIGRVISDGEIVYKGLITLQYNPSEPFRIILIKPEPVNPLAWNLEDSTSTYLNAFNQDPHVYTDEIFSEGAMYFRYPAISTSLIYNKDPLMYADAKLISRFSHTTKCFIKPYIVVPEVSTVSFLKAQIRFKYDPDQDAEEGWVDLLRPSADIEVDSIYEHATQHEVIENTGGTLAYLSDALYRLNGIKTFESSTEALWNAETDQRTYQMSSGVSPYAVPNGMTIRRWNGYTYDYVKSVFTQTVKDLSRLNARSLEIELRTVYTDETVETIDFPNSEKLIDGNNISSVTVTVQNATNLTPRDETFTFRKYTLTTYNVTANTVDYFIKNELTGQSATGTATYTDSTYFSFIYEGLTFRIDVKYIDNGVLGVTYNGLSIVLNFPKNIYTTVSTTQLIYLTGVKLFEENDILSTHNIYNATHMTQLDRYLVLYGPHMGNHSLQFLEYDNFSLAPFPNGQITFDAEIVHVHSHRGNLYVFCKDGIWILHSGFTYAEMIKTFAYSGIALHPAEIGTIASLGNNVFVVHNNKGFMIRTNQNVDDQSDVYTIPITGGVDQIMEDPRPYIMERLHYGYSILTHPEDEVTVYYKSFVDNNEIHLTASYFLRDPLEKLFISYIYNNDTGRWKMYDTICGGYPLEMIPSGNAKGFDYLLINDFNDGVVSVATYLHEIPTNSLYEYTLGDSLGLVRDTDNEWKPSNTTNGVIHPFIPISCEVDFGSLDLQSMHKKVIRRFYVNIINVEGEQLTFKALPYIDGVVTNDDSAVEALLNAIGELQESIDLNTEIIVPDYYNFVSPAIAEIEGLAIPESFFTTQSRVILDIRTHLVGKIPGLKLLIPTTSRYHITHYAIIYRQLMAR